MTQAASVPAAVIGPVTWNCPARGAAPSPELALVCDRRRASRLLIVPALFDESNRMRRFAADLMRALDRRGIDSFLPDLPGCNESLRESAGVTLPDWHAAMAEAARHFSASATLGIRGGCLLTPPGLPAWHYAPAKGSAILRQMLRARLLAAREAGREENREDLEHTARASGIILGGHILGPSFYSEFEEAGPTIPAHPIAQAQLGGAGLWLRAEPGDDCKQAETLADLLAQGLAQ
ncbi:hypothetical protein [Novosphingobium aureum]|uniref:hypothetical protein n=1 Tax=Novosphingobium aureum TaxID=2792964 RepID=UPI001E390593|nr:hypothetical protein [Novosphingobium aureum]